MTYLAIALVLPNQAVLPDGSVVRFERMSELTTTQSMRSWDSAGHLIDVADPKEKSLLLDRSRRDSSNARKIAVVVSLQTKEPSRGWGPSLAMKFKVFVGSMGLVANQGPKFLFVEIVRLPKNVSDQDLGVRVGPGRFTVYGHEKIATKGRLSPAFAAPKVSATVAKSGKAVRLAFVAWSPPKGKFEADFRPRAILNNGKAIDCEFTQSEGNRSFSAFDVPPSQKIAALQVDARPVYHATLGRVSFVPKSRNP